MTPEQYQGHEAINGAEYWGERREYLRNTVGDVLETTNADVYQLKDGSGRAVLVSDTDTPDWTELHDDVKAKAQETGWTFDGRVLEFLKKKGVSL